MAMTREEKNRKARERRAAMKVVGGTASVETNSPEALKKWATGEAEKVLAKATGNGKVDDDMPAFLDRTNPENEKKAKEAADKRAEELRNRPAPTLVKSAAAVTTTGTKPAAKKGTGKAPSLYRTVKLFVVKEPNIGIDALMKKVKAAGFANPNSSTVATVRADTRDTMKLCQEELKVALGVL